MEKARDDERPDALFHLEMEARRYMGAQLRSRAAINKAWHMAAASSSRQPHGGSSPPPLPPRNPISEVLASLDSKVVTEVI
jgi:hypothetical protein